MEAEYEPLQGSKLQNRPARNAKKITTLMGVGLALSSVVWFTGSSILSSSSSSSKHVTFSQQGYAPDTLRCGSIEPVGPEFNKSIELIFRDPDFRQKSLENFSGAIQIPTEIQDTNPQPNDDLDYYQRFFQFHDYLETTFPLVHQHLKREKVNSVALLYTWNGSDPSLKPLMLTAHQDVVPVNPATADNWTYPPFSGHYDNKTDLVWGRGAADCKNLLIGELEAVEQLLKDGFEPKRSVVLAFGFDEESSGLLGAHDLGEFLYERYGDNGIYAVVDEGGGIVPIDKNVYVAAPITAEKGYVDVEITVHGVGGHSSVPPDHTTIGVAASLITLLESNPFPPTFTPENPFYGFLTCAAEHSSRLPNEWKKAILDAPFDSEQKHQLISLVSSERSLRDLLRTSQAVDIIQGGIKANALPEMTSFVVNHRIDINSSVKKTLERDLQFVKKVAEQFHYGVVCDGEEIVPSTDLGYIEVLTKKTLEPAPRSPVTDSKVWDLFAGTIQNVFENGHFKDDSDVEFYVTQSLISGNTDTRYYWRLTENIYRFMAIIVDKALMHTIHSVDEHISLSSHLSTVAFVYEYIVNVSEKA
ncbi:LAFA_0G04104g1_1 [Lachancea sp. 'fantastica']|nr:LAFA_0G04104g1_1 [Lachancea sp. 'fantastica']